MFLALQVISDVLYIFKQHQMKTRPNEFGSMYGSVPYVLLFIVHMYYDFHDRVCTTVDSQKYYAFFANSHMYYYLSLVCTTVQSQSLISSTIYYSKK